MASSSRLNSFSSRMRGYTTATLALLISALPLPVAAAEPITVELIDGRTLTGEVDAKTDTQHLWLRRETAGIQLGSGLSWDQVESLRRGKQTIAAPDWRTEAAALKSSGKSYRDMASAVPSSSTTTQDKIDLRPAPVPRKVQSLHIEAHVARWSRETATDGVRVLVFPLSANGELVPIDGQLDLTLFGELRNARGGEQTVLSPRFLELERSSELVRKGDFTQGPAAYQITFEKAHPDVDYELARNAVVHARLGIAGQGVFEASAACVPLREVSPIRDQLQLYTPQRFFPGENVQLREHLPRP